MLWCMPAEHLIQKPALNVEDQLVRKHQRNLIRILMNMYDYFNRQGSRVSHIQIHCRRAWFVYILNIPTRTAISIRIKATNVIRNVIYG